uniref:protein-glutamine gamma-glutamyltransferase n=1 Tax=Mastacembelus armatus TaxID=205130 RepID=A0A7N9AL23_9TELE
MRLGKKEKLLFLSGKRDEVVIKGRKERGAGDKWWFNEQQVQNEILLTVHSPADAIVGQYRLAVLLMTPTGHIFQETKKVEFHLLFNPWCKDDVVYLPEENLLQEYIMNEAGIIYMGAWDNIKSIPWNYGQFEDYVMDICFEVLDNSNNALKNSKMDMELRSDPVYVSRIITAMVNSNGDRGLLTGKWNEPYTDGVPPYQWTGSVPILKQWSKNGIRTVKYGQCWVFAGVACTVLRCLGIPTRLITNFSSAHDVDGNLSVDFLLDERYDSINRQRDSSWNFHCWVESWMRRDDLPKGNDGWQVLDPTPQELSDGEFCCGPCPVAAIKEGNVGVKYDARFVFAEVNADIIYWMVKQDGQVDQSGVGKNISTKSVYGDHREDVTLHYKYPEGSKEEREVYKRAGGQHNALFYSLCSAHKEVLRLRYDDYVRCISDHNQIRVKAVLEALGENKPIMAMANIPLSRPELLIQVGDLILAETMMSYTVLCTLIYSCKAQSPLVFPQVPGKAVVQQQVTAYISFTNPLPVALNGGVFTVEGAGLLYATKVHVRGNVFPGQKVSVKLAFSPMRTGVRKLLVDFDSDRLKDVKGVATLVVRKKY